MVAVNGRFLSRRVTGVERYGREVLRCLTVRPRLLCPENSLQGVRGHLWEQAALPLRLRPGETLWSPANTGPLAVRRQALTLHDLSPLEHPEWFSPAFALWYRLFLPPLARRARRIITPSEFVRGKVLRRFSLPPERVVAASGGVDLRRFHPGCEPVRGLPEVYVLFVGSLQPRKNLAVLLQAWEQARHACSSAWLLVSGAGGHVFRSGRPAANPTRVAYLGYIPDSSLPGLYAGALALALPSLDEGFGLTALEAMACGAPVLAARAGALPETVGEAGLLFDPSSPEELATALRRCLVDAELRCELAEKGRRRARIFPWRRTAAQVWEALQQCREP